MAVEKGSECRVYVAASTAGSPTPSGTTLLGKTYDHNFPRTPVTDDLTTDDSGMYDEHGVIRYTGDCTFKMKLDRADAAQVVLRAATNVAAGGADNDGFVNVVRRPRGTGTGRPQEAFRASVSISDAHMVNNFAVVDVTLKPTGPITNTTQA